jgi:hypothetical protein
MKVELNKCLINNNCKMKKIIVLAAAIIIATISHAQSLVVCGNVKDASNGTSVGFCNIAVYSDTTLKAKIINGTTSDVNGKFVIKVKKQSYALKVSFMGYETKSFLLKDMKKEKDTIFLNDVLLKPSAEALNQVEVVAKQNKYEMNNDKIVTNVDENVAATSVNAFELLRKVPGVTIDKDENLKFNGQSGVLFQFDGRDMNLPYNSMKSILKGTSPKDVEKIETISNPSSKYEAQGTAGIINIIFAKNKTNGLSGDVNSFTGYEKEWSYNDGFNLNYVNKKWVVSLGANLMSWAGRNSSAIDEYIWHNNDTINFKQENTESKYRFNSQNVNLSADYKINDNNSLGFTLNYSHDKQPNIDNPASITNILHSPYISIDSSYSTKNVSGNKDNSLSSSLYYNHKLDSLGGQYTIDFDFDWNKSNSNNSSLTQYYDGYLANLIRGERIDALTTNKYNTYSLKFDEVKPLSKKFTLEFGAKTRLTTVNNDFHALKDSVNDVSQTNNLKYKENVNAAYVSLSTKFNDKLSLRLGLRGEHTYTHTDQVTTNEKKDKNYFDLFPNVNFSWAINKSNHLSTTYSYRITRPEYSSLNPFSVKQSDYSYTSGNPNLNPEYSHKIDVNYSWNYIIFLNGSYSYTKDLISDSYTVLPGSLITVQKPDNYGSYQNASLSLSTALPVTKWLMITLWCNGTYQKTKATKDNLDVDLDKFGFQMWSSLDIDFFFKTKLTASCFYMTGGTNGPTSYGNMFSTNFSLSRYFFDKKLNVALGVNNLPKRDFHVTTTAKNMKADVNMCWQRPMATINISYNFGKSAQNNALKKIESDDMDKRSSGSSNMGQGNNQGQGK